jgi:hypothetical protein
MELAGLLYNLQGVPGIYPIYRRIVSDPSSVEATILEMEGMRLFWVCNLPFRIIHSGGGQGLNYECEVALRGVGTAYCEMKTKLENLEFSHSTVIGTLNKARSQLPEGACGIILLKVPDRWIKEADTRLRLEAAIHEVFRNTERVTEVVIYTKQLVVGDERHFHLGSIWELGNPRSPHLPSLNPPILNNRDMRSWLQFSTITEESLKAL